jgi:hypothetical protein
VPEREKEAAPPLRADRPCSELILASL